MKKINIKVFIMLSIIAMIAFAGCTGKNEPTSTTPQGAVQTPQGVMTPQGDVQSSTSEKLRTICEANKYYDRQEGSFKLESKGIVDYEGKEFCLVITTHPEGSIEAYGNFETTINIIKDKSGKITLKSVSNSTLR